MPTPPPPAPPASRTVRGLVSSPSDDATVRSTVRTPPPGLHDVVETFWRGDWAFPPGPDGRPGEHTTELISDPTVNFVLERSDDGIDLRIVGVWTTLWRRTLRGRGRVRGVKLRPGAFCAFSSAEAHTVKNRIVPLDRLGDVDRTALITTVLDDDDEERAFSAFAQWLESIRRPEAHDDVSLACALVERIRRDSDLDTVEKLVLVAGISERPLQRLFRAFVGVSPKWLIRRYRLQDVAARIVAGEGDHLATLAATLGYTDQAHLAHDFTQTVGVSPSAFRKRIHARNLEQRS